MMFVPTEKPIPNDWAVEIRPHPVRWGSRERELFFHDSFRLVPPPQVNLLKGRYIKDGRSESFAKITRKFLARQHEFFSILETPPKRINNTVTIEKAAFFFGEDSRNYFHWVTESLVGILKLAQEFPEHRLLIPSRLSSLRFVQDSLELLGVSYVEVLQGQTVRTDELATCQLPFPPGNYFSDSLRLLNRTVLERAKPFIDMEFPSPRLLWVSRQNARKRRVVNHDEVERLVRSRGFTVVDAERLSFIEQVALFSRATVVAGVHGAGLTNALFSKKLGALLEIRSPNDPRNNCYYSLAGALGFSYGFIEGATWRKGRNANLQIDLNTLNRALDELL